MGYAKLKNRILAGKGYKKTVLDWSLLSSWIATITFLSLIPANRVSMNFFYFSQADKVIHFVFYFGFSMLLFRLLYNSKMKIDRSILIVAAVIPIVYSGIIELMQEYLVATRNADFFDFAVNMIGAIVATILYRYLLRFEFNRFYTKEFS